MEQCVWYASCPLSCMDLTGAAEGLRVDESEWGDGRGGVVSSFVREVASVSAAASDGCIVPPTSVYVLASPIFWFATQSLLTLIRSQLIHSTMIPQHLKRQRGRDKGRKKQKAKRQNARQESKPYGKTQRNYRELRSYKKKHSLRITPTPL
jgi:hypothetical protein